jgi:hypothetical protein
MKKIDSLKTRTQMVEMHTVYKNDLNEAMSKGNYITATWLCYSIIEQRTNRVIEKYLFQCPKEKRKEKTSDTCAISTRLKCIKYLNEMNYACFISISSNLIQDILDWCEKRNSLMHDLVKITRYKNYDKEFKCIAIKGCDLVNEYYKAADTFREWYQDDENELPNITHWKCGNSIRQRCMKE